MDAPGRAARPPLSSRDDAGLLERAGLVPERLGAEERHQLLVETASRSRRYASNRFARLKGTAWQIVQAAGAASAAWLIAGDLLGHSSPVFAPLAALITLTATRGQRVRQAAELMVGVALGVGIGDVLTGAIGTGILQLALIVTLALSGATLLNASGILFTEAAVSATLVATVEPTTRGFPPVRFIDALIGGAVALVLSQVLFPAHPVKVVEQAARSMLTELAQTLEDIAAALDAGDIDAAEQALVRSREISDDWAGYQRALDVGREAARFSPRRRGQRERFAAYAGVGLPLDLLVRDVQVLARATVRILNIGDPFPGEMVTTLRDLSHVVSRIEGEFEDPDREQEETRDIALRATRVATASAPDQNLSLSLLVGHTQATAADLLRTQGLERDPAHELVGQAAVQAQEEGADGER
jgi:uncharacterized membrane protein YgaE (UPF0421/DUF939 family)